MPIYEKNLFLTAFSLPLYVSNKYAVVRMDAGHITGGLLNPAAVAVYLFCKNVPEKLFDGNRGKLLLMKKDPAGKEKQSSLQEKDHPCTV